MVMFKFEYERTEPNELKPEEIVIFWKEFEEVITGKE